MALATTARDVRTVLVAGLAALAVAALTVWTHWLHPSMHVGMVPVTGVTLAALLLVEPGRWMVPIAAISVAVSGVGLLYDSDFAAAVAPAIAAVVGSVVGASLLRVFAHGPFVLRRVADVVALTALGALGAFAGAAAGAAVAKPSWVHGDYWMAVSRVGVAGAVGVVVVTTALLSWATRPVLLRKPPATEALVLGLAVALSAVLAFREWSDPRGYVVVLLLVWAAVRFRLPGVSTAALVMVAIADWGVARHAGPLVPAGQVTSATILQLQVFVAASVLALLLLAAALDERDVADAGRRVASDRFRRTFDSTPVGIAVTTLDGVVVEANAALCEMLGYSRGELVGLELEALRARDDLSGEYELSHFPTAGAQHPALGERRYVSARGDRVWAEVSESQVRGIDGKPESRVVLLNDVTRRKDLEEQLLHAQKMDAVGRLAGGIAHDFNNLLAVMRGHAELLEDDLAVLEQARRRLASMQRTTDTAVALTDDLLTFSRRRADEPETIDFHEVCTVASEMLGQLVGPGVIIDLRLAATSTWIHADRHRIEQALVNLIVNAGDAMSYRGRLTIATSNLYWSDRPGQPARALRIAVSDTGTGMTPEVQRKIFEPFFTTKPPGSGTGLGLSTAYGVVRGCGGSITVDSRLGEGTTFVITLPVTQAAPAGADASRGATPEGSVNARPETILVVDDEPDVRAIMAEVLRGSGYRVLEAANAGAALDLVSTAHESIDLLLSDVVMPGMGGPELADRIRVHSPDTEALFVSGYSEIEPTAPGLRGATLLRKPLQRATLVAEVASALEQHDTRIKARSGTRHPAP